MNNQDIQKEAHYDVYDYSTFWHGRNYEDLSDKVAIDRLLKKTTMRNRIIDVGGGLGRLVPCYIHLYKEAVLIDPSSVQLARTEKEIGERYPNLSFLQGTAEHLPYADGTIDTIVCVRVSHHIPDIAVAFAEYHRVLKSEGYLIMEIANKLHVKSRIKAMLKGKTKELHSAAPVSARQHSTDASIAFVNHNPKAIAQLLEKQGFEVITILSASNFRSGFLKKALPLSFLMFWERLLQRPLAGLWFGPSIYFFARKK
jgi:ubiquinone/menaquinone biosynthesis C-methylase UbiE